jgi:hypothetical protein
MAIVDGNLNGKIDKGESLMGKTGKITPSNIYPYCCPL